MRYRRYYAKKHDDGSVSVVSHGPTIAGWRMLYSNSLLGTFIVFVIAFCLINPFQRQSEPFMAWAIIWGFVGVGLHGAAKIKKRRLQNPHQP